MLRAVVFYLVPVSWYRYVSMTPPLDGIVVTTYGDMASACRACVLLRALLVPGSRKSST